MNDNFKRKLTEYLRNEAENIVKNKEDKRELIEKLEEMNDIDNMLKILKNYTELEPFLKKFFNKKANKDKWERGS